jgi:diguanylate cyclase (GGDEF)-like protein
MYRVLSCLAFEHDYRLVVLAALVSIATTLTAFLMYSNIESAAHGRRLSWAVFTGVCAGAGIWTTHFVAMLAYQSSLPTYYHPVETLLSLLIAIVLAASGFALATRARLWSSIAGGLVIGAAIGTMHYVGMGALAIPGKLEWDPSLVTASLVLGPGLAVLAMLIFRLQKGLAGIVGAAAVMALSICTLHFTAMGAATVVPDPTILFVASGIDRNEMALAVVAVAVIVLILGAASVVVQNANDRWEAQLRQQNAHFESVLRYLPVGLSIFDRNERLVMCNPEYRELHNLPQDATQPGLKFANFLRRKMECEGDVCPMKAQHAKIHELLADHAFKLASNNAFTDVVHLKDGRTLLKRVGRIEGGGWVDVEEDVTALKKSDQRIEWLARHDALTGIANRYQFRHLLERQFECYDPRLGFALHWIDLDKFKEINDELGHPVGDALLKSVARRLASSLRIGDVVGRLGGDEFAVLQINVGDKATAEAFAERILQNIAQTHDALGHRFTAGASIGIALAPQHGQDADALFSSADVALYHAKGAGRGVAVTYEPDAAAIVTPNPLLKELPFALERDEFALHYQPIVNLKQKAASGFEALMRWKHPNRGMIPPGDFLPLAERVGLVCDIGRWILNRACADAAGWPEFMHVAVNLSSVQIENCDVSSMVKTALDQSGIDPSRLHVEISDSTFAQSMDEARDLLLKLEAMGVTITLDQFGARLSHLNYLKELPISRVKIDESLVHDVSVRRNGIGVLRSVAALARDRKIVSVAQGVETNSDLAIVHGAGFDEAQGFYFSVPVPTERIAFAISRCEFRFGKTKAAPRNASTAAAA